LKSDNSKGNGKIELPYISDENDPTDFEVKATVEGDSKSLDTLRQEVRTAAIAYAKERIPEVLKELRTGMLPTCNNLQLLKKKQIWHRNKLLPAKFWTQHLKLLLKVCPH
jgi:hypothetical protein